MPLYFCLSQKASRKVGLRIRKPSTVFSSRHCGFYTVVYVGLLRIAELCAVFPLQCALAADQVVFTQKEMEMEELRNQVQLMVQENKGHAVSLKEAQKVNRLQVGLSA